MRDERLTGCAMVVQDDYMPTVTGVLLAVVLIDVDAIYVCCLYLNTRVQCTQVRAAIISEVLLQYSG